MPSHTPPPPKRSKTATHPDDNTTPKLLPPFEILSTLQRIINSPRRLEREFDVQASPQAIRSPSRPPISQNFPVGTNLYDIVKNIDTDPWKWARGGKRQTWSVSLDAQFALSHPGVSIIPCLDASVLAGFRQVLKDELRSREVTDSIRNELKNLDERDKLIKSHELCVENGLSHKSAMVLGHLLNLLVRTVDRNGRICFAGEWLGNMADWSVISSSSSSSTIPSSGGEPSSSASLSDDLSGDIGRCLLAIEFKTDYSCIPHDLRVIWELLCHIHQQGRELKIWCEKDKLQSNSDIHSTSLIGQGQTDGGEVPKMDDHHHHLLAQLIGYQQLYKTKFGILYNGDHFLVLQRNGPREYMMFPPVLRDGKKGDAQGDEIGFMETVLMCVCAAKKEEEEPIDFTERNQTPPSQGFEER
ncbi:hypothetical protein I302_102454 [Kwoniella bestiolae CBS 10118]|uniref:Uncharacterized protein n=1 Tax=Kwoniella bestiolae CBS 10118 TaxID=1296100 RepID=A0A1B9GF86_9TREE|nr:hypothetical protein I302_01144 [Kwoniella bestiolae CBS 10118]OCF29635.1 hypothetical protein I302_01144 [Kwoniella bestiolae CBS 10118]